MPLPRGALFIGGHDNGLKPGDNFPANETPSPGDAKTALGDVPAPGQVWGQAPPPGGESRSLALSSVESPAASPLLRSPDAL